MKIVVIGCDTYYGKGASFEKASIAASLEAMGHGVYFVPVRIHQPATERAVSAMVEFQPDLCLLIPHMYEVDPHQLRGFGCPIVLLLADDDWRRDFGLELADGCDYVLGNAPDSMQAYGAKSVPFEWAIYPPLFQGEPCERTYDVGFIAQVYGNRRDYIQALQDAGLAVLTRGFGFEGSAVAPDEMARLLRQCKIGLNLSATSQGNKKQVKIRPFEIAAAGAMILTEYAPGIEKSFTDGKQAVFFETIPEMVEAALYYKARNMARITIASSGYARVMAEHTLEKRWRVLFKAVGLS